MWLFCTNHLKPLFASPGHTQWDAKTPKRQIVEIPCMPMPMPMLMPLYVMSCHVMQRLVMHVIDALVHSSSGCHTASNWLNILYFTVAFLRWSWPDLLSWWNGFWRFGIGVMVWVFVDRGNAWVCDNLGHGVVIDGQHEHAWVWADGLLWRWTVNIHMRQLPLQVGRGSKLVTKVFHVF